MAAAAAAAAAPEFDIVIFGASGYTGKYVIREALKFLSAPSSPLRTLALAGRSPAKIAAALTWAAGPSPPPSIPIVPADVANPDSLAALARRCRVLLNCVGPFRLYGEPVFSACAAAGADYLDITGEPEFMERMEMKYHETAAAAGALMVSGCGFDSVPAELGWLFNSRQWVGPSAPSRVEAYLSLESDKKMVGNFGTFESAVLGIASVRSLQEMRRSRPKWPRPMIVGPPPPKGPTIEHQKELGFWAAKLPSADAVVVRRTQTTLTENHDGLAGMNESKEFSESRKKYWASIKPVHFGVKIVSKSLWGMIKYACFGIMLSLLGITAFGRSLLLKYPEFFTLGGFKKAGPTEEQVNSASFKMWFVGHGYSDTSNASSGTEKPDMQIITRVSGPEIGYLTTPIVLIQSALVLLSQRENLPKGGVYTPGIVFGPTDLQEKLQQNNISFEVISKSCPGH